MPSMAVAKSEIRISNIETNSKFKCSNDRNKSTTRNSGCFEHLNFGHSILFHAQHPASRPSGCALQAHGSSAIHGLRLVLRTSCFVFLDTTHVVLLSTGIYAVVSPFSVTFRCYWVECGHCFGQGVQCSVFGKRIIVLDRRLFRRAKYVLGFSLSFSEH